MCYGCWVEADKPHIDNPQVRNTAILISKLLGTYLNGGHLHIVIEDWNVGNESLQFCYSELKKDKELLKTDIQFEVYNQLNILTEEERLSALALLENFWS